MNEMLDALAKELQTVLPEKWFKVILCAEISENCYDIYFYCFIDGVKEAVQCYTLGNYGISEEMLDKAFEKIYNILMPFWSESAKTNEWTSCTFSLTPDGSFNLDLDYTDLVNNCYEYREKWVERYIKSVQI